MSLALKPESYFVHFQLSWLLVFLLMSGLKVLSKGVEKGKYFLFAKLSSFQLLLCLQNTLGEYGEQNCTGVDAVKQLIG